MLEYPSKPKRLVNADAVDVNLKNDIFKRELLSLSQIPLVAETSSLLVTGSQHHKPFKHLRFSGGTT